jgi:hypothetical protein
MICLTLATGGKACTTGAAAAVSPGGVRALAMMKPIPEMKSAALTRNNQ